MSVAILVLGYRAPEVLGAAIAIYRDAGFDVYVHVDATLDLDDYRTRMGLLAAECRFLEPRQRVFWGGYSMVRVELELLQAARAVSDYAQYALVSDDSVPLHNPRILGEYFADDLDRMECRRLAPGNPLLARYEEFFFLDHVATARQLRRPVMASPIDQEFLLAMMDLANLRETGKKKIDVHYGSQWWSLSRRTADLVMRTVTTDAHLRRSFMYSAFSDESYLQTIVAVYGDASKLRHRPMMVDWSRLPKPYEYPRAEELAASMGGQYAFARKFVPEAPAEIAEFIERLRAR